MKKITKYLLCVFFSILAINFLVNGFYAIKSNSSYLFSSRVAKNPKAEEVISLGKNIEEELEKSITNVKDTNGEDYPALGILYYETIQHHSSVRVIQNFLFSLIAGFSLGNIIFLIYVSGLSKYKLVLSLILVLFATSIFLALSDIYTAIANNEEIKFGLSEIFWNMETSTILYVITCIVVAVSHKIYKTYNEIRYS